MTTASLWRASGCHGVSMLELLLAIPGSHSITPCAWLRWMLFSRNLPVRMPGTQS